LNQNGWDNLIQMGFKPRSVTRVVKIYCSNGGLDTEYLANATVHLNVPAVRDFNPSSGSSSAAPGPNMSNLKYKKMSYVDSENVCQYTDVTATDLQPQQYNNYQNYRRQGYPAVPFGSAVLFRFRQFAPVQQTVTAAGVSTITQTAIRQTIPMDVYLDSVTTFKSPVMGTFDIDLPFSDPSFE